MAGLEGQKNAKREKGKTNGKTRNNKQEFQMRNQDRDQSKDLNIDQIELKGFSRSLTEIEFLLLILVILYIVVPGTTVTAEPFWMTLSMLAYAVFVLGFNYVNLDTPQYAWKLAPGNWL